MLRGAVSYLVVSVISVACLGILALMMLRDKIKDIDVGPFD